MTEVHVVTSTGVRLAYADSGPVDQPTIVLLHALGDQRGTWDSVTPMLAERFRVVAFDLRGHGDSDWPGTYGFQLMCDDILDALDRLGLDKVTLLGHSMGGVVCYRAAIRHPERVERLVVEDAPPPYERDRPVPVRDDQAYGFDWAVVPAIVAEVNAGDPETWQRLESIEAPTLLIAGGPESHVPQDKLAAVEALIPQCTLVTIPAGHHVHSNQSAAFIEAIFDWIDADSTGPDR